MTDKLTYGYYMSQPAVFIDGKWVTIGEIMAERDKLQKEVDRLKAEIAALRASAPAAPESGQ